MCANQFHIYYKYTSEYSCRVFGRRMSANCCNKHVIIITFLLIAIIITVIIFINYVGRDDKKLIYGLTALIVIESMILLAVVSHFIQTYLALKQIVLEKVFDMTELRSLASNNSD